MMYLMVISGEFLRKEPKVGWIRGQPLCPLIQSTFGFSELNKVASDIWRFKTSLYYPWQDTVNRFSGIFGVNSIFCRISGYSSPFPPILYDLYSASFEIRRCFSDRFVLNIPRMIQGLHNAGMQWHPFYTVSWLHSFCHLSWTVSETPGIQSGFCKLE